MSAMSEQPFGSLADMVVRKFEVLMDRIKDAGDRNALDDLDLYICRRLVKSLNGIPIKTPFDATTLSPRDFETK